MIIFIISGNLDRDVSLGEWTTAEMMNVRMIILHHSFSGPSVTTYPSLAPIHRIAPHHTACELESTNPLTILRLPQRVQLQFLLLLLPVLFSSD